MTQAKLKKTAWQVAGVVGVIAIGAAVVRSSKDVKESGRSWSEALAAQFKPIYDINRFA